MSETVAYGGQQLLIGVFHSQHDLIAKAGGSLEEFPKIDPAP